VGRALSVIASISAVGSCFGGAIAAVAASITFGASDAIEQRATHTVPERRPMDIKLFVDVVGSRRPGKIHSRSPSAAPDAGCRLPDL